MQPQYGRSTGERLARYENIDYGNSYGKMRRDRRKFKREDIVRADEEECDDGATERLEYFDYGETGRFDDSANKILRRNYLILVSISNCSSPIES